MDRIDEIKARCEAATPGAWYWENGRILTEDESYLVMKPWCNDDEYTIETYIDYSDADFVVHAREDIPYLLEQLEEAQRREAAALADLIMLRKKSGWKCFACKHDEVYSRKICSACDCNDNWEWRGPDEDQNGKGGRSPMRRGNLCWCRGGRRGKLSGSRAHTENCRRGRTW